MYATPSGYPDAVASPDRTVDAYLSIGTGIDTTAADDITAISGSFLPMSNTAQVTDAIYYMTEGLATFEGDGIPTSGSAIVPPSAPQGYPPETGIWSSAISDSTGAISFTTSLTFSKAHSSALRIYTGRKVTSATATFTNGSASTTKAFVVSDDWMEVSDVMTYTGITIAISGIDGAYRHARIVEIEFGASVALSKTELGGEVTLIRELDPTEQTIPTDELDLSIINVGGDFDTDNPSSRLGELAIGFPIWLSFTVVSATGARTTVPCGRYWVSQLDSSDTRVDIIAFDARHTLASIYGTWSLSTTQSIGKALDDVLTSASIPHEVDTALFQVMPDADAAFDSGTSLADDLVQIMQAYGIYLVPDRFGSVAVTTEWPAGAYGEVPTATMFAWPSPKQQTRYNVVSVEFGPDGETVETDLRTNASESRSVLQISGNPLIATQEKASTVMARLVARLASDAIEFEWRGDPAMDVGDSLQAPGRWTQSTPRTYKATYIETTYDGSYRAVVRGSR